MSMATDKTMARLSIALREREIDLDLATQMKALIDGGLSQTAASGFIGLLESLPERTDKRAKVTEPGYYRHENGNVCKVARSKKGYLYALEPRPGGQFKFISGLLRELDANNACEAPEPIPATRSDIEAALARALSA